MALSRFDALISACRNDKDALCRIIDSLTPELMMCMNGQGESIDIVLIKYGATQGAIYCIS